MPRNARDNKVGLLAEGGAGGEQGCFSSAGKSVKFPHFSAGVACFCREHPPRAPTPAGSGVCAGPPPTDWREGGSMLRGVLCPPVWWQRQKFENADGEAHLQQTIAK